MFSLYNKTETFLRREQHGEECVEEVDWGMLSEGVGMYIWWMVDGYRVCHLVDDEVHVSTWAAFTSEGNWCDNSYFNELDCCSDTGEFEDPFEAKEIFNASLFLYNITGITQSALVPLHFQHILWQPPADNMNNISKESYNALLLLSHHERDQALHTLPVVHGSGQKLYESMDAFFQRSKKKRVNVLENENNRDCERQLQREKIAESQVTPGCKGA
ncbi:hypothetical protein Moror_3596 [Moniliophthora roreri MCA 2997]|uniref:Uncharacterized protein n=1 Tax=Moniliophthora roreri (strain MCA 2997) TaxID=1381753 RepID=V2WE92_MONRO|nr:hypothetical protein Moror_3596 [Moniliophthora roreri MCA 2997]